MILQTLLNVLLPMLGKPKYRSNVVSVIPFLGRCRQPFPKTSLNLLRKRTFHVQRNFPERLKHPYVVLGLWNLVISGQPFFPRVGFAPSFHKKRAVYVQMLFAVANRLKQRLGA